MGLTPNVSDFISLHTIVFSAKASQESENTMITHIYISLYKHMTCRIIGEAMMLGVFLRLLAARARATSVPIA